MKTNIWKKALEDIKRNLDAVLILVAETKGSAPGKTGFKMLVSASGELVGTVGGGNAEYVMVEEAKRLLAEKRGGTILRRLEHREDAETESSGMICSGSNAMAMIYFDSGHRDLLEKVNRKIDAYTPFRLSITSEKMDLADYDEAEKKVEFVEDADGHWRYEENIHPGEMLYIIGGGHVGLALSRVADMLGFNIIVIDDRKDLNSIQANTWADEFVIIDYAEVDRYVPEGDHVYAVIMTAGHRADKLVLGKLAKKKLRYLGMMASKSKRVQVYRELIGEGVERYYLDRVYSPIGLSIRSITAEEIAVSIAAELIKVKNG